MANGEPDFMQGDLVWAQYPLTDKIDKLKRRPVLVISNTESNLLDSGYNYQGNSLRAFLANY